MKTKRRHELHTNVLADWMGKQIDAVRPYTTWIVGGLIAVVLAGVVISIRNARQSSEATEGWSDLERASSAAFSALSGNQPLPLTDALQRLQSIAEGYGNRPVGIYARLTMGDVHLNHGENQFRSNKSAAREQFKNAVTQYEAVAGATQDPQVKNRALFCLAKSYEWQDKFEKAKEYYGQVEGPYRAEAQQRLDSLSQPGTSAFYERLAKWKPKPPPLPDQPTGRYPGLNLDNDAPPAEGEVDYLHYLDATAAGVDLVPDLPAPADQSSAETPDSGAPAVEPPAEGSPPAESPATDSPPAEPPATEPPATEPPADGSPPAETPPATPDEDPSP